LGVRRPERETNHLPSGSTEVKNALNYTPAAPNVIIVWCIIKQWCGTWLSRRTTLLYHRLAVVTPAVTKLVVL